MKTLPTHLNVYVILLNIEDDDNYFLQNYWCITNDIGDAIEKVLHKGRDNGFKNIYPTYISLYETDSEKENIIIHLKIDPSKSFIGEALKIYSYPKSEANKFKLPYGVIISQENTEKDYDLLLRKGYQVSQNGELYIVNINVSNDDLINDYAALLHVYANYRVFWVQFHNYWSKTQSDLRVASEELNTPEKIMNFLNKNTINLIRNGYITLTAYMDQGTSNLSITDLKNIHLTTTDKKVLEKIKNHLHFMEYEPVENYQSYVRFCHYRHPQGLGFNNLIYYLLANSFEILKN